ncbi:sodium:proton antiporter [Alteribacter lacisalsi]|uniref:Sodium:proton antiporter n=1 Tax=Alteribacter lacisalsi TaxID=2045244 RepID=A0A2W0H3X2_9BACI|nr:Na+/H+ antiporter family protein [Alteribacter lacisalsi]PYZ95711.1 sodium:proton antiporter [Alteribacter lacisalsi]
MNAVIIAVLVMILLSLMRIHVVVALIAGALAGGLTAGFTVMETMDIFTSGLGTNATVALSYAMLGAFAVAINYTGLPDLLIKWAIKIVGSEGESKRKSYSKALLLFIIVIVSCMSQNVVMVHIAFIPLLIPPLLKIFNKLALDRRGAATALTFGLKAPYILIPAGYGLIFHGIVFDNMQDSGMSVEMSMIPQAMLLPVAGMLLGLLFALFVSYRKPRNYEDRSIRESDEETKTSYTPLSISVGIGAIIITLVTQVISESMIFSALLGLLVLYVYFAALHLTDKLSLQESEGLMTDGMKMLAFIAFVMITAGGFAEVIRESGHVDSLVDTVSGWVGDSQALAALLMLITGLFITMGIGSSFATIPIIAAIFVPLAAAVGFSPMATIALIGTAGALGDAGSPASDSTLGPTAGLNADGQHHHIWDTCVPTFLHFNIPLIVFGWFAAVIL